MPLHPRARRRLALSLLLTLCLGGHGALAQQLVIRPPVRSATLAEPDGLLLADLDGTGGLDVIVNPEAGSSSMPLVQLGALDGTVSAGVSLGGSPGTRAQAHGDFDEDGVLDLVTVGTVPGARAAHLRFGNGDGSFGPELTLPSGSLITQARAGDFDGDGHADVLLLRASAMLFQPGDCVIHYGAGDGSFPAAVAFEEIGSSGSALVADMDGDGVDDVVARHAYFPPGDEVLDVYLGSPARTLTRLPRCSVCVIDPFENLLHLVAGDFDGDGDTDLGFTEQDAAGIGRPSAVSILENDGNATLTPATPAPLFTSFSWLAVADMDGDGDDDLIGSSSSAFSGPSAGQAVASGEMNVARLEGGQVLAGPPLRVTTPGCRAVFAGDANADGRVDLVSLDQNAEEVCVLLNATYGEGEPFRDLGNALAGSHGFPVLVASGELRPGERLQFELSGGVPGEQAFLYLGWRRADLPFRGGVLVPDPARVVGPVSVDADGRATLGATWPRFASRGTERLGAGLRLYGQIWCSDPGGFSGYAATSAVEGRPRKLTRSQVR